MGLAISVAGKLLHQDIGLRIPATGRAWRMDRGVQEPRQLAPTWSWPLTSCISKECMQPEWQSLQRCNPSAPLSATNECHQRRFGNWLVARPSERLDGLEMPVAIPMRGRS
mmetsp:Transcript_19496/g.45310  ORF Transcript_19496/g.45310 Transcript_19496/m.45310 type:complete len:111 (+) Transcript_19496:445-777(+)